MSSFFGFDASLPRDKPHNVSAHGFGQVPDAFAGLSIENYDGDDGEALDFEDTYDGLGDRLDDADDAFNDDTFGAVPTDRNFDFAGQTAAVAGPASRQQQTARQNEYLLAQQPPPSAARQYVQQQSYVPQRQPAPVPSVRSGYEKYKEPDSITKLEASASIWGHQTQKPTSSVHHQQQQQPRQVTPQPQAQPAQPMSIANVTRKMMSLEEVEAMMRAQSARSSTTPVQPVQPPPAPQPTFLERSRETQQILLPQGRQLEQPLQHTPAAQPSMPTHSRDAQILPPNIVPGMHPQILQRPQPPQPPEAQPGMQSMNRSAQVGPQQRLPLQPLPVPAHTQAASVHTRGPSQGQRFLANQRQLQHMNEQERAAFLEEEAKRAKRNHKIHLLSRDNGLMTPQDKNFITRIQLQQLLTATGGLEEQSAEAMLSEDFYYQIFRQIRGPLMNPNQQLSQFAQTYLHQTAGRSGNRRYARGGDQIRRMEQQVQRAVEAAKLKPKSKQLVIEGSLGKISFANVKTPKPLLNLRRQDVSLQRLAKSSETVAGRKATLRAIESVYTTIMSMEEHERRMPPQATEESTADDIQEQMDWRARVQQLNGTLWNELKVMEPIDPSSKSSHPFISILSHSKGKKVLPRVFRQIDDQQRLTILTMIVIHLDALDVVRLAHPTPDTPMPAAVREEVELFSQTVMTCLFGYMTEAPLSTLVGLLGLILERVNVQFVARTKAGLALLTLFLSRAELIREAGHADPQDIKQFGAFYNDLFDLLEPTLPIVFTTPISAGDDMYVWQFLAALGVSASPEQQQRLVMGVKDRVMDSVAYAKPLPDEVGKPRLDNVNLFMRAIGLDVDLLG